MGLTLRVHKKHVVEYGDRAFFNYQQEQINTFFHTFIEGYVGNDEDYGHFSTSIELPKDEYLNFLKWFQNDKQRAEKLEEEGYDVNKPIDGFTIPELIEMFIAIYEQSDPTNSFINADWF